MNLLDIKKPLRLVIMIFFVGALSGCVNSGSNFILEELLNDPLGTKSQRKNAERDAAIKLKRDREAEEFRSVRQVWVGKSIDDLIMRRGSPWGVHKRTDGGSQYTFKKTQNSSHDPYLNNPRVCVDNFITDKKGIIKDWSSSNCRY
ncbi:MAG: hypothetical protein KA214_07115 [Neisseriaceae bacterium]|nr:hypothetical protein [Neisseriaceae bacterium]